MSSFHRSLRAVTNDKFGASFFGLAVSCLIMVLWVIWFLFAKVDVNEVSTNAQLSRDGSIIATFEPSVFAKLRPGQLAVVFVLQDEKTWQGEIAEVASRSANRLEPNTVRIYTPTNLPVIELDQVKVRVTTLSPLQYALRTR